MKAGAETHLPRLMTPRGIPVGVLKAGSSFSPSSNTLLLNTWKEKNQEGDLVSRHIQPVVSQFIISATRGAEPDLPDE